MTTLCEPEASITYMTFLLLLAMGIWIISINIAVLFICLFTPLGPLNIHYFVHKNNVFFSHARDGQFNFLLFSRMFDIPGR